ncbi:MAG: Alpha/beta hydrolase fold [Microbacteriaceae bacterium]|nr:Alpha/beta hydrolase fold [Microbacteriaceae bacterium]
MTTSDEVRLDYTESGDPQGRPIVLIAGFKAAATSWLYQLKDLEKAGFRVIALDTRGHGTSEKPDFGHSMQRRGIDLNDFLEHLDLHDAVLVGGSMGGNTIWAWLSRFAPTRVAGIVVIDQTPKMLNDESWPHGFYKYDASNELTMFEAGVPQTGHGTPLAKRGIRLVRLMNTIRKAGGAPSPSYTEGELTLLLDHARADWRDTIATSTLPVLFVAGDESEVWPSSHAAASAALNPKASSVIIPNAGHATNIEQPKTFNSAVIGFIRGL